MKVNYHGQIYIVSWKHNRRTDNTSYESTIATKGGSTECNIFAGLKKDYTQKFVAGAQAECHEADTYCRSTGRKISLTRALACCENKDFRKKVWEQYHKDCR